MPDSCNDRTNRQSIFIRALDNDDRVIRRIL